MSPFGKLLEKLAGAKVRYVLVGGGAVLLHGHLRTTGDLDILVEASEDNARRLLEALSAWGAGGGAELTIEDLANPAVGCLRVVEDFELDVFTLMVARRTGQSLAYADLIIDAQQTVTGAGITVTYASIARLIDLKTGTGRPKDASDIDILSEIERGLRDRIPVDLAATHPEPTTSADVSDQGVRPLTPRREGGPSQ